MEGSSVGVGPSGEDGNLRAGSGVVVTKLLVWEIEACSEGGSEEVMSAGRTSMFWSCRETGA
jgi:hypothetical protein